MAPIRVGFIGLSGAPPDQYEGTSWATKAHFPYLDPSPHYEIVALLNSSVESARAAIARHKLPASTKAYGKPEDLAADPDVDLVVSCVRVDRHFLTVRPSIVAGKAVFVEWPLDRNLQVAREMASLAAEHNVKTIVGIQGSFSPAARKIKATIESGKIGKVLSSSVYAILGNAGAAESKNVRYFLDRNVGGNVISIHLGHALESITYVLGNFESFNSLLAIRRPTIDIVDKNDNDKLISKAVPNSVPDQILLHGTVAPSKAVVDLSFHGGKTFPGTPQLDWRIRGETGELRITSPTSSFSVGSPDTKIELFSYDGDGEVQTLVPDRDHWDDLPVTAQNIAREYEAYRKGEWYPDFEWAVNRHEFIDELWRRFDESG